MTTKTGGRNTAWIVLDRPKPLPVADRYAHWDAGPAERSARCAYWVAQIERGWRPNRHISRMGYDEAAEWYGVWIWEYLNVIAPMLGYGTAVTAAVRR